MGLLLLVFLAGSAVCPTSFSQDNVEVFCEGEDICSLNRLVFRWDENGESVLVHDPNAEREDGVVNNAGGIEHKGRARIGGTVFLDTVSERVSGWVFGLRHDADVLAVMPSDCAFTSINFACGTDAEDSLDTFSGLSYMVASDVVGEEDGSEAGFICAVILSFAHTHFLPVDELNSIAKITYAVVGEVPAEGAMVSFNGTDLRLGPDEQPIGLNINVDGEFRVPGTLVHGRLEAPVRVSAFLRGDWTGNGVIQMDDAISLLSWLFLGGVAPTCMDAADADNSGGVQLTDGISILNFLFLGTGPATLGIGCEVYPEDEAEDNLFCESYTNC